VHNHEALDRVLFNFRAADWPSERSEWAQPDVAILLTQISYYWDGELIVKVLEWVVARKRTSRLCL